jgi:hypothetical protein
VAPASQGKERPSRLGKEMPTQKRTISKVSSLIESQGMHLYYELGYGSGQFLNSFESRKFEN